jgi:hypothetical protein
MGWGVFLVCWAMAAVVALTSGRDANWDLRNYHYYNAYALLEGRWDLDLAPAGAHSFLHPGLDLPFYLVTQSALNDWPRIIAVLQAGYLGLLAFLVLCVVNLVCHGEARRLSGTSAMTAAFGLTGAATLAEAGTTFNDLQISCLAIGALLALLVARKADDVAATRRATRLRLLAGTLGGAAVGLKLTAVIFPPALALAAIIAGPSGARCQIRALAQLAAGGALGISVIYGPWGWFLFERFESPFGPFLNGLFHSPWFPPEAGRDTRFLPTGPWQGLIYPLLWASRSEGLVTEWPVADPRFAIGLAALLVTVGAEMRRRLMEEVEAAEDLNARRVTWAVMGFIAAGYVTWLATFGILRYAGPVEVLLGVPIWAAARELLAPTRPAPDGADGLKRTSALAAERSGPARAACVAVALACCASVTLYPEWNRQPFSWADEPRVTKAVAVARVELPEGSLVAMVGPAVSFTAPFLAGPGIRFIGAPHPGEAGAAVFRTQMAESVRKAAQSHDGPTFAVVEDPDDYDSEVAEAYGIELDLSSCTELPNNLTTLVRMCRWRGPEGLVSQ